jgi:hypothetical protein
MKRLVLRAFVHYSPEDIIHRPVFYLKQRFGDWILCLGDRDYLYLLVLTN